MLMMSTPIRKGKDAGGYQRMIPVYSDLLKRITIFSRHKFMNLINSFPFSG
jgi:hypothetical protein